MSMVKNVLTIGFDPEFADHLPLVDNSKNHALVQTKLAELGHPHTQVRFVKAEDSGRERGAVSAPGSYAPAAKTGRRPFRGSGRPGEDESCPGNRAFDQGGF